MAGRRSAHGGATLTRPKKKPVRVRQSLREDFVRSKAPHQVDRDAGVIKGVKVIGLVSENGRRYTPESLTRAKALYEGRVVNIDHPAKPGEQRSADDRFGRLCNVRVGDDGLYADLEYLKSHPMAERICEAAERMPEVFGLSHNAQGEGETARDGTFVVHEIVEVRSVDVVADPATTSGLFEGKSMKKIKVKAFLEAAVKKLTEGRQKRLKRLLETDAMVANDLEMDEPADYGDDGADMEPDDHLKAGFRAAIIAVVDSDAAADEKLAKIKELVKAHEKLTAEPEDEEEAEEPDGKEDDPDAPKKKNTEEAECDKNEKMESRVQRLEREGKARDLCEAAGVPLFVKGARDEVLWESLLAAKDEPGMKRIIDREKSRLPAGNRPRSSAPGGVQLTEAQKGLGKSAADDIAFLRNGRGAR